MGLLDDAKKKATEAVDTHGDKIEQGLDKAAQFADDKTGGKHSDKIAAVSEKVTKTLEGLDSKKDESP